MGREDQKEEREVLDSIFPDEITDISDTSYRVDIRLESPAGVVDDEEEDDAPTMVLRVSYPETYPDIAPDLELTTAPNARKYDHFDVQAEKAQLLDGLQPTIEENLGMPMIFTLVTTLKENAEALITERLEMAQKEKEAEALKAEEEENRKFQGEAVTKESFLTWMDGFKKEVAAEEKRLQEEKELEEKKKRVAQKEKKLTGRELWERGIAKGGDEDEEDDDGDEGDEDPPPPYEDVAKMSVRD